MKPVIGEERVVFVHGVADGAVAPFWIFKNCQTVDRGRRHCMLIAAKLIPIKSRIAAQQCSFEARQRFLNEREGDGSRPKRLGKLGLVGWIITNLRNGNV